jgi:hypothetical protein
MVLWFVLAVLPAVALVALYEYKRLTKLRHMARAERACAEFGKIRHELVLAMARGELRAEDPAWQFLYRSSSQVLLMPEFFREFTTYICLAVVTDDAGPKHLDPSQVNALTRPLLQRFVKGLDELIEEFAHPVIALFAFMSGQRIVEWIFQLRDATRELERRRSELLSLREAGVRALAA